MSTSLKKGLMYVLIANFINLGFNLITNFVLPKELSVESYATIKTFQLYVSYAGLFHFGFVDGMYLKYGGKNVQDIRGEDLRTNLSNVYTILITNSDGIDDDARIYADDIYYVNRKEYAIYDNQPIDFDMYKIVESIFLINASIFAV